MSKKKLLLSIVTVFIIGLAIVGGTFAYFQWTINYEDGTGVNVTIEMGGITMHIESEETEFVGLYPTNDCSNKYRYGDTLVTVVNNTGTVALPSFKLKVRVLKNGTQPLTSNDLKHIHYSVVPIKTTKNLDGEPVKGDVVGGYNCGNVPSVVSTDKGGLLTNGEGEVSSSFTFESVDVNGGWSHLPKANDKSSTGVATTAGYLPRQYFVGADSVLTGHNVGDTAGITFTAGTYTTTYQYYRVYVWMDEGYTTTIVGNTVSDPLQNAKIEIMWSEESMIQQVSGESVEQALAAGLYAEDGTYTSWEELTGNGDITVVDDVVTNSNRDLTGSLVIAEGITEVGEYAFGEHDTGNEFLSGSSLSSVYIPASVYSIGVFAFENSSLQTITFAPGSQLKTIEEGAFRSTSITSIEIPASVEEFRDFVFYESSLSSITFAPGSQLISIGYYAFQNTNITSIEIPSTVTSIGLSAFENSSLSSITFAPGSQLIEILDSAFAYTNITSIEIPSTVTSIGDAAFYDSSLSSITFAPNSVLTTIGNDAFYGTNITSIEIPSTVTSIGVSAFAASSLSSITFAPGSQLTTIERTAFQDTYITSIEIPSTVTSIGLSAFENSYLSSITFMGTVAQWNAINKDAYWNYGVPATKVICSDGEISLTN